MKNIFLFSFVIFFQLLSLAQHDLYTSKAWVEFIEKEIVYNDTVIAIGSRYAKYEDCEKRIVFEKIIVLYPNDDGDWLARKFYAGKNDTIFSCAYFLSINENFIKSNFTDLRELFVSNAGFKGINISGDGAISFYMKIGNEIIYENYFKNLGVVGIASLLETDLELMFLYYSIGNNTVP